MKEKYEKIRETFVSNVSPAEEEMFPHPANVFTRDRIASKMKQTRVKYRKSLNSGRQGIGGGIVAILFDIFNKMWIGFPATESVESGLESCDTREQREQQAEEDPAESADNDASAFGNFHDDTLTAANES